MSDELKREMDAVDLMGLELARVLVTALANTNDESDALRARIAKLEARVESLRAHLNDCSELSLLRAADVQRLGAQWAAVPWEDIATCADWTHDGLPVSHPVMQVVESLRAWLNANRPDPSPAPPAVA